VCENSTSVCINQSLWAIGIGIIVFVIVFFAYPEYEKEGQKMTDREEPKITSMKRMVVVFLIVVAIVVIFSLSYMGFFR
jgi:heme/copper-type cytochrome/quinol oxidase subunit 2